MTKRTRVPIIEANDLYRSYGETVAVYDVSLRVYESEVFGILGPNSAGKTTTLEMLETLRPIERGAAHITGLDVKRDIDAVKRIIGLQTQSTAFHDKVTLREHIEFFASIYGVDVDPTKVLADVQMQGKELAYFETLSGGQKQRFSIAVALLHDPRILFLDEPTTGLDPQARRNIWDMLQRLKSTGITVVLTTHYMEEAELLCDRLAIMDEGKVIALDTPTNLIKAYVQKTGDQKANLEDVFIDLTGKALRD